MLAKKKKKKKNPEQSIQLLNKRFGKKLANIKKQSEDIEDEDNEEQVEAVFAGHAERLERLQSELTPEAYDIECLKAVKSLLIALIPIAEENYRKFPAHTAASALNQLISQLRESSADQRSLESFQERANLLVELIKDEYIHLTEHMIESIRGLESRVKKSGDITKESRECLKEQGEFLKNSREEIGRKVLQMLVSSDSKKPR